LLDLQPDTARVVRDGQELEVDINDVRMGDMVRVRPGEGVPVDGQVVGGHSAVDQSLVTGEPLPVEKTERDDVIGGSINTVGTLLIRVTAVGEQSFLQQVIRHVEDARALKPGILHLVDRILKVYAPLVLIASALAFVGWLGGSYLLTGHVDLQRAAFAALSVLVMGYPCAVGIAAPLSIVRGAGEAADRGIIMRTGEAFQGFRLVKIIVFDKTGTLTVGKPSVREVVSLGDPDELLSLAAAVEASPSILSVRRSSATHSIEDSRCPTLMTSSRSPVRELSRRSRGGESWSADRISLRNRASTSDSWTIAAQHSRTRVAP